MLDDKNASSLVSGIKVAFATALRTKMRKADISMSQLSQISGISRSVISGYLSDDPSLPNAVNLVKLACALDCPPGTFLPCQSSGTEDTMITDETQLIPARSLDKRVRETLELITDTKTNFIYYVPISIPDPLKTNSFFEFEYRNPITENFKLYVESIRKMVHLPLNGALILDEAVLIDLLDQRGQYKNLPREDAEEQLRRLISFSEERFPEWQVKVVRRLELQVSPCFLISNTLILQEFFDYINIIRNQRAISFVQTRLSDALRSGVDLLNWLPQSERNSNKQAVKRDITSNAFYSPDI